MDVVYPYDGGKLEILTLSIYSMSKLFDGCGKIHIYGKRPTNMIGDHDYWLNCRVVEMDDPLRINKTGNVVRKLLTACRDPEISDPFLYCADDVIALVPFDAPPFYCNGRLSEYENSSWYGCAIRRGGKILMGAGFTDWNCETHSPRVIHKTAFVEAMRLVDYESDTEYAPPFASIYANQLPGAKFVDAYCFKGRFANTYPNHVQEPFVSLDGNPGRECMDQCSRMVWLAEQGVCSPMPTLCNGMSSIVPVFGSARKTNAETVIRSWEVSGKPENCELIIAEPDGPPLLEYYGTARRVTFAGLDPDAWLLSHVRNRGVTAAQYNAIEWHDADVAYPPGYIQTAIAYASTEPFFSGWQMMAYMGPKGSQTMRLRYAQGYHYADLRECKLYPAWRSCGAGAAFVMRRELFDLVGPWAEFDGWGSEDQEYSARLYKIFGYYPDERAMPYILRHLWHEKAPRDKHAENKSKAQSAGAYKPRRGFVVVNDPQEGSGVRRKAKRMGDR